MFSCIWSARSRKLSVDSIKSEIKYKATVPILWMEHCVECAMPMCYSSCLVYAPRRDGRCLRFDGGISYANRKGDVYLSFRKWAKLEGVLPNTFLAIDNNKLNRTYNRIRFLEFIIKHLSKIF